MSLDVSVPCSNCAEAIRYGEKSCSNCKTSVSKTLRNALQDRLAASSEEFRTLQARRFQIKAAIIGLAVFSVLLLGLFSLLESGADTSPTSVKLTLTVDLVFLGALVMTAHAVARDSISKAILGLLVLVGSFALQSIFLGFDFRARFWVSIVAGGIAGYAIVAIRRSRASVTHTPGARRD
jgi:hypothetical protein